MNNKLRGLLAIAGLWGGATLIAFGPDWEFYGMALCALGGWHVGVLVAIAEDGR